MTEPADPTAGTSSPEQSSPGTSGPGAPRATGPTDPWRPPPAPAGERPTEQLGWPPVAAGSTWAPPPVGAAQTEPHTVFLGDADGPPAAPPSSARRSARGALSATGLLLAGLLVGAVAVWAVQSQSSDAAQTGATSGIGNGNGNANRLPFGQNNGNGQNGQLPNGQLPNGQAPNGGVGGGRDGEQRLVGTISAIGSSTVTVQVPGGSTTTYTVDSSSEIIRNGSRAALSDLKVGDLAFLHVYPQGSTMKVERIFAGALPGGGQGLPGFGGGPGGGPDDHNGAGSGGSTTT